MTPTILLYTIRLHRALEGVPRLPTRAELFLFGNIVLCAAFELPWPECSGRIVQRRPADRLSHFLHVRTIGSLCRRTILGGTSFVAPQLNGVTALLGEYLNSQRNGFLNYPLYATASSNPTHSYPGTLHVIRDGDNWFYYGRNGYSPAAGQGTLDVANFANVLRSQFYLYKIFE